MSIEDLAKEIGEHCEQAVTLMDKIFLPYSSRDLRDKWIAQKLQEFAAAILGRIDK